MMARASQAGFSLIDVLAALSIFAVVAAGMAKGTIASLRTNGFSKETAMAAALVQDSIEKFRAIDPTTNSALLTAGTHADANNPITSLGAANGYFTRTWTVTANTPRTGMSQVVVNVSWTNDTTRTLTGVAYLCSTSTCS
jgi:prepilin-type N-terminal cleavage/methylation domain-containing protein